MNEKTSARHHLGGTLIPGPNRQKVSEMLYREVDEFPTVLLRRRSNFTIFYSFRLWTSAGCGISSTLSATTRTTDRLNHLQTLYKVPSSISVKALP